MPESSPNTSGRLSSTAKVLTILDCFTPEQSELSLAQLSRMLSEPKSSLLNRVRTLEDFGFLTRIKDTQNYKLGLKTLELAYCAQTSYIIKQLAVPVMEDLVSKTNEIVYLTTHINGKLFYLECVYPNHRAISYSIVGRTLPLHCTGSGKAMMSFMPSSQVDAIIKTIGLSKFTENTFTNPDLYRLELEKCRIRGYALDLEEQNHNVKCVAMAIKNSSSYPIGALSISGSPISLKDDLIELYASYLSSACQTLASYSSLFPFQPIDS